MGIGDCSPGPEGPRLPLFLHLPRIETQAIYFLTTSLARLLHRCPRSVVMQSLAFLGARVAGSLGPSSAEMAEQAMAKQAVMDLKQHMSPTSAVRVTSWMLLSLMATMPQESPEEMGYWQEPIDAEKMLGR